MVHAVSTPLRVRAVLLDVDGTLLDSNDAHAAAFVEAMREEGFEASFEHVRRLIGMGSDKLLPEAVGVEKDSRPGKRIAERKKEIFKAAHLPSLSPCPGARQLVQSLRERGFEFIVSSSAGADELQDLLKAAKVDDLLDQSTSSDDADESKPEPDILTAALKKLRVSADEAVLIGDTPYDIEAAERAGIAVIAVRCGGWDDHSLGAAVAVLNDPADVRDHLDALLTRKTR